MNAPTADGPEVLLPIVVDMDGTLLLTDTLIESVLQLVSERPLAAALLPLWWLKGGRAGLKRAVAERVRLDVTGLPVHEGLLAWLIARRAEGCTLHLVSAADSAVAVAVAERFGIFDSVLGSDGRVNLSAEAKLEAIRATIGPRFAYAGDSRKDIPVWQGGRVAVLVGRGVRLRPLLPPDVTVLQEFSLPAPNLATWRRALRLHQWAKNALIFVAALLGGDPIGDLPIAAMGYLVFGLMASATYLLNDMLDLPHDRRHRSKRFRPLASGLLPLESGAAAIGVLGLAAGLLLLALPMGFALSAGVYLLVTLSYSLHIKRRLMMDVFTLAGLFTIRVGAGIAVVQRPASPWLLAFSMFFFLSLACLKRYTECQMLSAAGLEAAAGRAYRPVDAPWLMAMGAGAAFSAASTFFLFLVEAGSPVLGYAHPDWMWLVCVMISYWLCRSWALAQRGLMNDDPVLFAMRDRLSLVLAAVTVLLAVVARG